MVLWCGLKLSVRCVVSGLLRRDPGADQGQPSFALCLEPLGRRCKVICGRLPLVLGLKVLGKGYTV